MSTEQDRPLTKAEAWKHRAASRQKGEPYEASSGKLIPRKSKPKEGVSCKCRYSCKTLPYELKEKLFQEVHQLTEGDQGSYLLGRIRLQNVARRRYGKYFDPKESRRQVTFTYFVPDTGGDDTQVCSRTFREVFGVSYRRLQTLQDKKKRGESVYRDGRGKNPKSNQHKFKYTEAERERVRDHIKSFPRHVSHYSLMKSRREFLSPDLNPHKMFRLFKEKHPTSTVSYRYYGRVLQKDFSKLKFGCPVAACSTCPRSRAAAPSTSLHQEKGIQHDSGSASEES